MNFMSSQSTYLKRNKGYTNANQSNASPPIESNSFLEKVAATADAERVAQGSHRHHQAQVCPTQQPNE